MSNPPFLTRFDAWLKHVGKSRDGIIVVGGALYILGYIVWSVNAYIKKLGLLPAFESQYFIAGIVPFLIIFLAYYLIRSGWTGKLRLPAWLNIGGTRKWWESFLGLLPSIFVVGSATLSKAGLTKYFAGRTTLIGGIIASAAGLLVVLAIFSIDLGSEDPLKLRDAETKWKERILIGARLAIIVVAGLVVLYVYVGLLYSKLPQSLGGVRPRCAYLDIERNGISKNTLKAILPLDGSTPIGVIPTPLVTGANSTTVTAPAEAEITRSEKLEVLFSGSDYELIRVNGEVYEIKKEVIHAVQSCD